jgi:hypothetical protein
VSGDEFDAGPINDALHRLMGVDPCRSACTHFLAGRWSLLGVANVVGRAPQRNTRIEELEAAIRAHRAAVEPESLSGMPNLVSVAEADDDLWSILEDKP